MSIESETVKATVDLADLFTVTVSSKQLELVLSSILSRLGDVEKDLASKSSSDGSGGAGKDWGDAVDELRADLEKERQRSDNQQAAINDLEEAGEKAKEDIQKLDEKKADKKAKNSSDDDHNGHNNNGLQEQFAKKLKELEDANNALAARVATLEGLVASSNPNAAKEQGLSSFTDTLNDVLKQQKDLEKRLSDAESTLKDNDKNDDNMLDRIDALEKQQQQDQQQQNNGDLATKKDLDDLKRNLLLDLGKNGGSNGNAPSAAGGSSSLMDGILGDLEALKRNLKDLEKSSKQQQQQQPNTNDTINNKNNIVGGNTAGEATDLSELERRVGALENASEALRKGLAEHKAETGKKIDSLTADVEDVKDVVGNAVKEIKALGQECSKNTADCKLLHDKKADKTTSLSSPDLKKSAGTPPPSSHLGGSPTIQGGNSNGNDANLHAQQIANLEKLLEALETRVSGLSQDKASKDSVNQMNRDLGDVKSNLKQLQTALDALLNGGGDANNNNGIGGGGNASLSALLANAGAGGGSSGASSSSAAAVEQIDKDVKELQKRLADLESWAKGQFVEIRATVDHIHHAKADAAIVANKAERDYVENAMEKLMHEVENVLNATNAGLIDTLDKSLNILRDMIDGKATKQDINKLQGMMGQQQQAGGGGQQGGEVPDGLASYKSYRCLGCNRTMETMRPRPMGSTMNAFTSRVPPASGRNAPASSQGLRSATLIQQQQQQHAALPAPPSTPPTVGGTGAGYITNTPSK